MSIRSATNLAVLTAIVALCLVAATVLYFHPSSQAQHQRDAEKVGKDKINKLPVADFDAPEPSDLDNREKRRVKNKKYNDPNSDSYRNHILTSGIGAIRNEWDFGLDSALPTTQSSAVIVGEVADANAYLSEDKYKVYSEFTVRVDEVIKNDSGEPIAVGESIATDRLGGRVRVPSGRVGSFYVSGQGVPEVGKRYVFFLGFNPREAGGITDPRYLNRHILTAYELRLGVVFPLDSSGAKNFHEYEGMGEAAFINKIRQSLAGSSQVPSN